ncbi:unnamed protein product [Rotaria sordida]|nr:unnamed protein product [Rotaria sordida]CAF1002114.1 unnamed protein product [Rotaria sordida]CAF1242390.1 unnamed protein product [Rotaria sordida]CAF3560056.1 unnamed protein product [Rotaria sordida]
MLSKCRQDLLSSSSNDENQPSASTFRSSQIVQKDLVNTGTNNSRKKCRQQDVESDDNGKLIHIKYKSNQLVEAHGPRDVDATVTVEVNIGKELKPKAGDKIDRGIDNYRQFHEKENWSSDVVRNKGRIRAPFHLRTSVQ